MKLRYIIIILFSMVNMSQAQNFPTVFPKKNYPTKDFINPFHFPISLAGNYGECRANHFHSGLDIRSQKVENKPVHAIAGGFVSRIKISHTGFGNALYVTHPNGYTSLYAHLNSFSPKIQKFVERTQYAQQKWDIDTYFNFYDMVIMQDEVIALSGNTGSSTAPHLHLEIRDNETENTLNPWLFGFQIPDNIAPQIYSLGYYDMSSSQNFYQKEPNYISISGSGNSYSLSKPLVTNTDKIGFSVQAIDFMNDKTGKLGVYETQMYVDNQLYFAWQVDNISYDDTRYLHAFADYMAYKSKNKWYQCSFLQPGNLLNIFLDPTEKKGIVDLSDGKSHNIKFVLYDVVGNKSIFQFAVVKGGNAKSNIQCNHPEPWDDDFTIKNNTVKAEFPEHSIYDNECINITQSGSMIIIGNYKIPVHNFYKIIIPSSGNEMDKYVLELLNDNNQPTKGSATHLESGSLVCEAYREFGKFMLSKDLTPPTINSNLKNGIVLKSGSIISINSDDDKTSVRSLSVRANEKWLCFKRRQNNYSYRIDSHCPKGDVTFVIESMDENQNTKKQSYKLKVI